MTAQSRAATAKRASISLAVAPSLFLRGRDRHRAQDGHARPHHARSAVHRRGARGTFWTYCEDDVRALARLVPAHRPDHPLAPARDGSARSSVGDRAAGAPRRPARPAAARTASATHWDAMRADLVREMDRPFGIYEFEDGKPHWRKQRFADYVRRTHVLADIRGRLARRDRPDISRNGGQVSADRPAA